METASRCLHDSLHRLVGETNNGGYDHTSYSYDAIGNITQKTVTTPAGATTAYVYSYADAAHKHAVSAISVNGVTFAYRYDANGNMTGGHDFTNPGAPAARAINYNPDNMPTRVVNNGITADFVYDAAGARAMKAVAGGSTTYYVNADYEIKDGVVVKYISAAGSKIAQITGADINYFHSDHLGSSTVMTNASGVRKWGHPLKGHRQEKNIFFGNKYCPLFIARKTPSIFYTYCRSFFRLRCQS